MDSLQTFQASAQGRVPCDFSDCQKTFTRQQDMIRHKKEVHRDAKHCPWCPYEARRDQRLLAHIDLYHRPKHRSSGDLNSPQQYEDPQPEDIVKTEMGVAEEELLVRGTMGVDSKGLSLGLSSQKNSFEVSPPLNQYPEPSSSSQAFAASNQGLLKQDYPAESSTGSNFRQMSNTIPRKVASRHSLSKGSRNLEAKPELMSPDDWRVANQTGASQMLGSIPHANMPNDPKDVYKVTSINQVQGYRSSQPRAQVQVQVQPAMSSPTSFYPYPHTSFDEPTTVPYTPSQHSFASTTTPSVFQDPGQTHTQTYPTSSTSFNGQSQVPLHPYTMPTAHSQNTQPPTTSFIDGQTSVFFNSANVPRSNGW